MQRNDPSRTDLAPPHALAASLALRRRHARLRRHRIEDAPRTASNGSDTSRCAPALDVIRDEALANNMHSPMQNTRFYTRANCTRCTTAERPCVASDRKLGRIPQPYSMYGEESRPTISGAQQQGRGAIRPS
jgi:hypothetical protein